MDSAERAPPYACDIPSSQKSVVICSTAEKSNATYQYQ